MQVSYTSENPAQVSMHVLQERKKKRKKKNFPQKPKKANPLFVFFNSHH